MKERNERHKVALKLGLGYNSSRAHSWNKALGFKLLCSSTTLQLHALGYLYFIALGLVLKNLTNSANGLLAC
jgi:hypothetical protein